MINWRKLLFKLHLRSSYPTTLGTIGGVPIPANIIRTDGKSHDIRPDIKTDGYIKPRPSMIHFDVYTPPPIDDHYLASKLGKDVYIVNGVDPIKRIDLTK